MMSMGFMSDSLNNTDPSKSAFFEFGHGHSAHQQHSQGLSHIYPVNGLHSAGHSQHGSPFSPSASSYGRSLGYTYPSAVNTHPPSAYISHQHQNHNSLAHSKFDPGTYSIKQCCDSLTQTIICVHKILSGLICKSQCAKCAY
ncbi:hypothetical protein UPYG_G00139320 [Umbra pygmaea]|uniref:Distal-less homeobox protein 4b n=1 Tax=Umbra pygmaea TaxID=75934 RepID=A0ABD0WUY4_UMBPY